MRDVVLPAMDDFAPDLVMISAGFDAHRRDPLAQLELDTEDFVWASDALREIAGKRAQDALFPPWKVAMTCMRSANRQRPMSGL